MATSHLGPELWWSALPYISYTHEITNPSLVDEINHKGLVFYRHSLLGCLPGCIVASSDG